jgi:hypothetical protein
MAARRHEANVWAYVGIGRPTYGDCLHTLPPSNRLAASPTTDTSVARKLLPARLHSQTYIGGTSAVSGRFTRTMARI